MLRGAAVAIAALAVAGGSHAAIKVKVYRQSLKDVATVWAVRTSAPVTTWAPAGGEGGVGPGGRQSTFGPAGAQDTLFRKAEVAPERIGLTRTLMSELKARTTLSRTIVVDLPADVLFDFDKATLRPDAEAPLRKAAALITSYPTAPVTINGHTDSQGDDAYNQGLSMRRATTVAGHLKAATGRDFAVRGLGEREPVAPNAKPDGADDPDGRQKNRRVEIIIAPPPAR